MKNSKKINIAIIGHHFVGWSGGVDFVERILNSLASVADSEAVNLFFILPNNRLSFFDKIILRLKILAKIILRKDYKKVLAKIDKKFLCKKDLELKFKGFSNRVKIAFVDDKKSKLRSCAEKMKIDVTLFADQELSNSIPNISYYPDLQHKYLTNFFSQQEIEARDRNIACLLHKSQMMIVNAQDVKDDLQKFFAVESRKCKIFALPFAPMILDREWLEDLNYDVLNKYHLPQKYFLISNQLWIHKNHITAIKALKLFIANNPAFDDVAIVCTGSTADYRFPNYFDDLKNQIKEMSLEKKIIFLDLIDRRDQIEILKKAIALIQPTLFEGGPGGGSFYDAVSLGVPTIISDIRVNCEVKGEIENNFYFKAKDAEDLCDKMMMVYNRDLQRSNNEDLMLNSKNRSHILGNKILQIVREIITKN